MAGSLLQRILQESEGMGSAELRVAPVICDSKRWKIGNCWRSIGGIQSTRQT